MDLLTLWDLKKEQIDDILRLSEELKGEYKKGILNKTLENKTLVMVFQKTSTRTRCSFEAGMTQLGGHAIYLDWRTTQFTMADIRDETKCIARYADVIMARLLRNEDLRKMAGASTVPVINGLCEKYHPCQALGDLLTIKEKKGKLKGVKLAYIGIANNVSNSLTMGCAKTGVEFTLCAPERHPTSVDERIIEYAKETGLYREEKDPKKAVEGADVVYTDSWIDMELFLDPKFKEEKERRIKKFMPYQVNKALLEGSDALIMHDLPAHRGYEIDDYAMESPNSIMFDQAENRLHIQKGILAYLLKK